MNISVNYQHILLVGNGTKLLDYEYGKYIDRFENVVRFNGYITDGYEKHIGTKTDTYVCNRYFQKKFQEFNGQKHLYNPFNKKIIKCNSKYKIPNCFLLRYKKEMKYSKKQVFSLGFAMILYFLYKQKEKSVCIANFNFNTDHYYEGKYTGPREHNFHQEKQIVSKLVEEGKVIIFEDLFL